MTIKLEVGQEQVDEVTGAPMSEVTMRGSPTDIAALKSHPGFNDVVQSPSVRIPVEDMEPQPDLESGETVLAIRLIGKSEDVRFAVKMFESIVAQVGLHEHDRQRAIAEARVKTAEKTPIGEAIRSKIVELLSGDTPLTPNLLSKIIRMAESGRDLLAAEKISLDQLGLIGRRRRKHGLFNPPGLAMYGDDMDDMGENYGQVVGGVLAPSPPAENFGMAAIREMVEGFRTANDSPTKLVEALAAARSANMPDVAAVLEKRLGITPKVETGVVSPKSLLPASEVEPVHEPAAPRHLHVVDSEAVAVEAETRLLAKVLSTPGGVVVERRDWPAAEALVKRGEIVLSDPWGAGLDFRRAEAAPPAHATPVDSGPTKGST